MKSKNIYFYIAVVILALLLVFSVMSCKIGGKKTEDSKKISSGVISLLDSLGVGDVPGYPGANYDKELNDQLGEFRNQLSGNPC